MRKHLTANVVFTWRANLLRECPFVTKFCVLLLLFTPRVLAGCLHISHSFPGIFGSKGPCRARTSDSHPLWSALYVLEALSVSVCCGRASVSVPDHLPGVGALCVSVPGRESWGDVGAASGLGVVRSWFEASAGFRWGCVSAVMCLSPREVLKKGASGPVCWRGTVRQTSVGLCEAASTGAHGREVTALVNSAVCGVGSVDQANSLGSCAKHSNMSRRQ